MDSHQVDAVFATSAPAVAVEKLTAPPVPLREGEIAVVTNLDSRPDLNWKAMLVLEGPRADDPDQRVAVRRLLRPRQPGIRVKAAKLFRVDEPGEPLTPLKIAVLVKHGMSMDDAYAIKKHFNVEYEAPKDGEHGAHIAMRETPPIAL